VWKSKVNSTLLRLTGYQLQKPTLRSKPISGGPSRSADEAAIRRLQRKRERNVLHGRARKAVAPRDEANATLREPTQNVAKGRAKRGIPKHYDAEAVEIIRAVRPRTMTGHEKLYGLVQATRYVVQHKIPGEVVECGVWRGGSMQAVALTLNQLGATDRHLHLFDTFEGMPAPTEKDSRRGVSAQNLLDARDRHHKVWAVAGLEDVEEGMREVDYPMDRVHFHKGLVEDTVPAEAPDEIAILRLDTDWYASTRHELEHLYERLSPGGVLIIDDYGDWEGARLATEEFLASSGEALLMLPLAAGRIAVKPFS
jgi:hypothetical protein